MDRDASTRQTSRRSTAVGIWSFLLVLIVLAPSKVPILVAVVLVLAVLAASGFSLLVMINQLSDDRRWFWRQNWSVLVAFGIPLAWSLLMGVQSKPPIGLLLLFIAVLPFTFMRLVFIVRSAAMIQSVSNLQSADQRPLPSNSNEPVTAIAIADMATRDFTDALDDNNPDIGLHEMEAASLDQASFETEEPMSSDITQWLTRSLTADGEIIEGGFRIEFADGQRDFTIHISFCPPLRGVPEITTEDLDGCDLEVRVSAAFPFGARFTVRRLPNSTADRTRFRAETCRIGFVAVLATIRRAA